MKRLMIVLSLAACGCAGVPGGFVPAPSVSGNWIVTGDSIKGPLELQEKAGAITGDYNALVMLYPVSGTREGNKITLTIDFSKESPYTEKGTPATLRGEVSADGKTITGTVDGDKAFKAKRF